MECFHPKVDSWEEVVLEKPQVILKSIRVKSTNPNPFSLQCGKFWLFACVFFILFYFTFVFLFYKCRYSHYFTWNSDVECSTSALSTYFILCTSTSHICSCLSNHPKVPGLSNHTSAVLQTKHGKCAAPSSSRWPLPTSGPDVCNEMLIWKALLDCRRSANQVITHPAIQRGFS